jgi:hypothetical protein
MSLPHRHGWPTAEDAERSSVYTTNPGAVIVTDCPFCPKVHVDVPKAAPARLLTVSHDEVPRWVRRLVLERDGYCCVCCGRSILGQRYSLGHRLRASQGGERVPSNLITLLGRGGEQCYGRIDLCKDPRDAVNGYRVELQQDPALIPVLVFGQHGPARVWLTEGERYSLAQPELTAGRSGSTA